jgi:hypothetical protein
VKDGVLELCLKRTGTDSDSIKVTIDVKSLDEVLLTGSGEIAVKGVLGKEFDATIAGSGMITASGVADSASVRLDGKGHIDVHDLVTKSTTAGINGKGTIEVNATESLVGKINGSGEITYAGSPANITRSINGKGSIAPRK